VWLRHLVMAHQNGLDAHPRVVAELGPGDSLGIGLAALISGCERYFGLDLVEFANNKRNLQVFEELLALFKARAPIPNEAELPNVKPTLPGYAFPSDILDDERLTHALARERLDRIRGSLARVNQVDSLVQYRAPWRQANLLENHSIDMIFSQAVLEHIDDLWGTYQAMGLWLKPSGFLSHQIDFKCHGTAVEWNGHFAYGDLTWRLIRGRRPYLLNREPHSAHLEALTKLGYRIVCDQKVRSPSRLQASDLAPRFRGLSEEDLTTSGAFIQAVRAL
jgi:SAM-dependent methyltransferase